MVAYYSELLTGNVEELSKTEFLYPYLNINDKRELVRGLMEALKAFKVSKAELKKAVDEAFSAQSAYIKAIRDAGKAAVSFARENGRRIMILAGRPYHIDSEIGHGIDKLASSLGFVVVSEDSICHLADIPEVKVLNQWTYHARLYRAAKYATEHDDTELVQLVSFGCGIDAITTDEVRSILESKGKLYTQLKIDEINNLGAAKIRLRSLAAAIKNKEQE